MVLEQMQSCWGPLWLAHHEDIWSSQWSKPPEIHWPPFMRKNKSLLWYPFQCCEWKATSESLQPSFTALSSRAIFMFQWIRLSFIHKTLDLNSLFFTCHVKKLVCFYEPQFGQISVNIPFWFWLAYYSVLYESMEHADDTVVHFGNKVFMENWKECLGNLMDSLF